MSAPTTSHKGSRSKSGCQTCRARKVRCDERPGICQNCEKLGLPCTGPASSSNDSPVVYAGPKRKRTFRSCTECRATKTRCSGDRPVCVRCRERSLQCSYEDSSEPAWKQQLRFSMMQQSVPSNGAVAGVSPSPELPSTSPQAADDEDGRRVSASHSDNRMPDGVSRPSEGSAGRLQSWPLPENEQVRVFVEYYFVHIHPLRCFGFLHKPSFMQRLDRDDLTSRDDDALLLIVCALGALFYAVETNVTESPSTVAAAGSQWAKRSQELILSQLGNICVDNLMAAILVHDYELRKGNFGNAFMLSGLTARMAQALQINLEHSTDILCQDANSGPNASTKESRRRLMWCCYITDSLVGSGVEQLTLIKETDIKIQLPCNERNFLLQTPCITEVLGPGQFLKFLSEESLPSYPSDNMGIRAWYIRYISIRRKVLKYIKHLNVAKQPWLPDSEFIALDNESRAWHAALPASLQFTPSAIYIRKETSQLGALCALHFMYHQNMCDLYRIGAPALYKLRSAFNFPREQTNFLNYLQNELFRHARALAKITAEALRHGPHALADSWIPTVVYDCCRVLLYYLTQIVDPASERGKTLMTETIPLIRSNVRALKTMQSMYGVAELLWNAAEKMIEKIGIGPEATQAGQRIIPDEPYPSNGSEEDEQSVPGTPVQSAPDYVLNPLSIFRMARKAIPEKHAPEKQLNANAPGATKLGRNMLQRRATLQRVPNEPANGSNSTTAAPGSSYHDFTQNQAVFDDLLSLFTTDPSGWTWHPSDTAMGSQTESNGLPPWEPTYVDQQLDAWMPMPMPASQQIEYSY